MESAAPLRMYARFTEEDMAGNGPRPATQPGRPTRNSTTEPHRQLSELRLPQPRKMAGAGGGGRYGEGPGGMLSVPPSRGHSSLASRGTTGAGTRPGSRADVGHSMPMMKSSMSMPGFERPTTPEQIYKAAKADLNGRGADRRGSTGFAPAAAWHTPPTEFAGGSSGGGSLTAAAVTGGGGGGGGGTGGISGARGLQQPLP